MSEEIHHKARIIQINETGEGQRVDNYLFKFLKNIPKSRIYRMLRTGEVRINKKRSKPSDKLNFGDEVRLPPLHQSSSVQIMLPKDVHDRLLNAILYEDEDLMVINKPPGLAVHGGTENSFGVIDILRQALPTLKCLELAHRLDKDTSGCLLIAKKRESLKALQQLFKEGGCQKTYFALVHGRWPKNWHSIDDPLLKSLLPSGGHRVSVHPEGKEALTTVNIETLFAKHSLLRLSPKTGRTHQLRVHLSYRGYPIVGDLKYGQRRLDQTLPATEKSRLFLHAQKIAFIHPKTQEKLSVEAPLYADLQAVLEQISV